MGRQKLPPYIITLNIIMIVIFLAICGLIFALTMYAKDLGWSVPAPDDNSAPASVSEVSAADAQDSSAAGITVQASSAE